MRPQVVTVSSAAISAPLPVNWRERDFKLGLGVSLSAGADLTCSVQHTFDNPQDFTSPTDYNTNATWYDTTGLTSLTGSDSGNIVVPVRAVRLNVTVFTSGDATLTVLQAL